MRFAITSEQKSFYKLHQYIEFDAFIPLAQLSAYQKEIERILFQRIPREKHPSSMELFLAGRDIWRDSATIKSLSLNPKIAEIACTLIPSLKLRIAYDQVIKTSSKITPHSPPAFCAAPVSLQKISSFQDLLCGVIFLLSPLESHAVPGESPLIPLPHKEGNSLFFSPDRQIDLAPLFSIPDITLLLVAYCKETSVYRLNPQDPHTHALKKLGYQFGDKLRNEQHPLVFQSTL